MVSRRLCLTQLALLAPPTLWLPRTARASAQPWNKAAFEASSVEAALKALGIARPIQSQEVQLQADELSENGAKVPITFSCSASGVKRLALLVEKNPSPLCAVFDWTDRVEPRWVLPVKVAQSSHVMAVAVLADGRALWARRELRVTLGGCAADDGQPVQSTSAAPRATRIRAEMQGPGLVRVRALFAHDMESGQRKDASGQPLPAWHIAQVTALHQERVVWTAQWGGSVSRNPLLQFTLKGASVGDKLRLTWVDNRGATRSDEVQVAS